MNSSISWPENDSVQYLALIWLTNNELVVEEHKNIVLMIYLKVGMRVYLFLWLSQRSEKLKFLSSEVLKMYKTSHSGGTCKDGAIFWKADVSLKYL